MRVNAIWQVWDGNLEHLQADHSLSQLPETLSGEFYRGQFALKTAFQLFYAYRLSNAVIVYNAD